MRDLRFWRRWQRKDLPDNRAPHSRKVCTESSLKNLSFSRNSAPGMKHIHRRVHKTHHPFFINRYTLVHIFATYLRERLLNLILTACMRFDQNFIYVFHLLRAVPWVSRHFLDQVSHINKTFYTAREKSILFLMNRMMLLFTGNKTRSTTSLQF